VTADDEFENYRAKEKTIRGEKHNICSVNVAFGPRSGVFKRRGSRG